jgi:hypothetical protein
MERAFGVRVRTWAAARRGDVEGSRSCPSAGEHPETMKHLVIPIPQSRERNLALVLFWSGNNARFLTSFGMTALFQSRRSSDCGS